MTSDFIGVKHAPKIGSLGFPVVTIVLNINTLPWIVKVTVHFPFPAGSYEETVTVKDRGKWTVTLTFKDGYRIEIRVSSGQGRDGDLLSLYITYIPPGAPPFKIGADAKEPAFLKIGANPLNHKRLRVTFWKFEARPNLQGFSHFRVRCDFVRGTLKVYDRFPRFLGGGCLRTTVEREDGIWYPWFKYVHKDERWESDDPLFPLRFWRVPLPAFRD